jgi:outer membrane protein OmpA-like peptidoglycan-associated protein
VNGSNRQAVNDTQAAEILALRARIAALEQEQQERLRLLQQPVPTVPPMPASETFSVHFPLNGTNFRLGIHETASLLSALVKARRIEVRGRTDNDQSTAGDEIIALKRAQAVQRYLIGQGVPPGIVSINHLSAGDYVSDNASATGRALNRRVDIEVFYQSVKEKQP